MSYKISVATCAALLMCSGFLSQVFAVQTTKLEGIEVNSVGDNISESGIDEGILNKRVAAGPLADKKVIDMPYQVNTISKEVLDNQGVQAFDEAVKYFPSAQLQYRGGGEMGRPQTRGFQGSVVGNVLWDGFYAVSTTAIPMVMFESLQIQNGLAGSLYGGQDPAGIFSYSRKRPVADYNAIWTNYISRGNLGVGFDTSNKFEKIGYRGVFYYTDGEREPKDSKTSRRLASIGLDFFQLMT
ncbi:TonB-dependent receptor plug domain-containing protein [Campylobacter concisus]|uniref:TonB-dependent receptor plug domain-containing protein n=1 Tax=Campylobacter concisus TaxID=199 RepID=UPI001CB70C15|nr:TonB-dependent receptor plug domain-containing protein [Campylobacter concisus]